MFILGESVHNVSDVNIRINWRTAHTVRHTRRSNRSRRANSGCSMEKKCAKVIENRWPATREGECSKVDTLLCVRCLLSEQSYVSGQGFRLIPSASRLQERKRAGSTHSSVSACKFVITEKTPLYPFIQLVIMMHIMYGIYKVVHTRYRNLQTQGLSGKITAQNTHDLVPLFSWLLEEKKRAGGAKIGWLGTGRELSLRAGNV